jgi:hypothetical protein
MMRQLEARLAALESTAGMTEVSTPPPRERQGFLYLEGLS